MATHEPLLRHVTVSAKSPVSIAWKAEYHSEIPHANVVSELPEGHVVSKCHPMSRFPIDMHFSRRTVYTEWKIMRRLSRQNVCPNFVRHYDAYVAPCRVKTMLDKPTPEWALYTINEYCNGGDLEHWQMAGGPHSPEEWQSMMAQFLLGYTALAGVAHVVHRDMHWGNLLMKRTEPGGFWWYIVRDRLGDRTDFFVPNTGQQWKLWDFGQSMVLSAPPSALKAYALEKQRHDIDNILSGVWEFAHETNQRPVIRGQCRHSMEDLLDIPVWPESEPALEILKELGWYQEKPVSGILNQDRPYVIQLV